LAEINLRGFTGATVIAIVRGDEQIFVPGAGEVLCGEDMLVLAGSREEIGAAHALLRGEAS
jgi:CPA2 family monovalent cation:H+ antiporter-2